MKSCRSDCLKNQVVIGFSFHFVPSLSKVLRMVNGFRMATHPRGACEELTLQCVINYRDERYSDESLLA